MMPGYLEIPYFELLMDVSWVTVGTPVGVISDPLLTNKGQGTGKIQPITTEDQGYCGAGIWRFKTSLCLLGVWPAMPPWKML
ncbi:hypothetical protein DPMN_087565 [Dreissena polymorpha]|uniref:Uncharacterized protein n=1 Tax=Dreissena polymorpha TaxID=45954 RepID=A0A9D4KSI2_DREPO|nr:hypothetical protein DPMN_087565 [Dreissena polymorpha]